ncbi:hypothetical protein MNEG_0394 [Monoraphidium neglectum]|uniref:Uncharacterized protein n=1 Tax=Monoraphidium neglectum TaxID=145388 RepID=A0A0D2N5L0_9CHLO|nr:hypothetical protein MNEG_0394 [Monoraphidium neglectum]KIZ07557.1 hypothetical protein MNEG_0394 [Monoraphidium neglectum]|eukprot:XP_013906576.1 hypothetical protein MNEG_0394 [Monoraphidium neglectum]
MARHALAAVLVLGCAAHLVAGYPAFFYSKQKGCTAHPDRGYRGHQAPQNDTTTTVAILDSAGKAVTTVCPGVAYSVKLSFGEVRLALITTNAGSFPGADAACPGRLAVDRSAPTPLGGFAPRELQTITLNVACSAATSVKIDVTSAHGSKAAYKRTAATLPVNPACAAAACAAKAKPAVKPAAKPAAKPVDAGTKAASPAPKVASPTPKVTKPAATQGDKTASPKSP